MKHIPLFILSLIMMTACATGTAVSNIELAPMDKSVIIGVVWYLWEIRSGDTVIGLNRQELKAGGEANMYSLRFDRDGYVSGKAAPNNYRGSCVWGDDSTLSFGVLASTKMAALKEPEPLKEQEYFDYLSRVDRWILTAATKLELHTTDKDGVRSVMIFEKSS
jgi:hypothetical protein